ncbi:MAG: CPBP family intramembrane metalloprotease [Ruminococcus sp.]|nr:CPBP family intramembrane metalloprotease [Ruminococcus sp.]
MYTENTVEENTESSAYSSETMRSSSNGNSLMLFIFLICMIGGGYLVRFILGQYLDKDSQLYDNAAFLTGMMFQYFVGVPLAIFIYKNTPSGRTTEKIGSLFCKPQQSAWWVIKWVLITIAFTYGTSVASNMFFELLQSLTGIELNQTDLSADDTFLSKFGNIVSITLLAPIFEEILMRGALLGNTKRYGTWSAVVSTGIFFGLLHANYPQIPFAAVMGVFSAFMVLKTKSIIPSLIVHFTINTIGGVMSLFTGNVDLEEMQNGNINVIMENLGTYIIIMCAGFLVLGLIGTGLILFILEIVMHKESFHIDPVCPEVSEKKKLAVYFTAPLTILLTVVLLALTVVNALPV